MVQRRDAPSGRILLVIACLLMSCSAFRHFGATWSADPRGSVPQQYSSVWVENQLQHGWAATKGVPVSIAVAEPSLGTTRLFYNWHHPPAHTLWLSAAAAWLGPREWVLRLAHLVLFLPALVALFLLLRPYRVPHLPGVATLLFATTPLVGFFGPMVVQDGEVLSLGLWTVWAFQRDLMVGSLRSWAVVAVLFFCTCSFDIPGYLWGPTLLLVGWLAPAQRRALGSVFGLFLVSLAALALLLWHYGLVLGGPMGFVREAMGAAVAEGRTCDFVARRSAWTYWVEDLGWHYASFGVAGFAVLGLILAGRPSGRPLRPAAGMGAALCLPGILNCLLFPAHALEHAFWPLQGHAGLAVLAAIGVVQGHRRLWLATTPAVGDAARRVSTALGLLVILGGIVRTWQLLQPVPTIEPWLPAFVRSESKDLGGSRFVLSTVSVVPGLVDGRYLAGGVTTMAGLQLLLHIGKVEGLHDALAFVVPAEHLELPIVSALNQLAEPRACAGALVYLLTPSTIRR